MFKKLKSLFIIEDEQQSSAPKAAGDVGESASEDTGNSYMDDQSVIEDIPEREEGKVSERFLRILLKALEENNRDGFDYLEFKEFLRALDSMNLDEPTKYQSAYANARTMGATFEGIEQSTRHYLDVLKNEELKFEAAVKNQRVKIVENRQNELQKLETLVNEKEEKIRQLTEEIEKHKGQMTEEQKKISEARAKIERTKSDFLFTYNTLVKQIQSDIQNIHHYLK